MFKQSLLTIALLSMGSSAVASTQTVNLSPKAAHTLDLKSQGCMVEKAFFGDPSAGEHLDLSLDQPQPRTQKITLRWKPKADTDSMFLQLQLQGCSQDYAQISIQRVDDPPESPVTYINAPIAQSSVEDSTPPTTRRPPIGQVATRQPLPLSLTRKAPTRPKIVKRPPVRRSSVLPPSQGVLARKSAVRITPSDLLRGLNIARNKGEIGFNSPMHHQVNGMIRAMRQGSEPEAARQAVGVPTSVVEALISYSQR